MILCLFVLLIFRQSPIDLLTIVWLYLQLGDLEQAHTILGMLNIDEISDLLADNPELLYQQDKNQLTFLAQVNSNYAIGPIHGTKWRALYMDECAFYSVMHLMNGGDLLCPEVDLYCPSMTKQTNWHFCQNWVFTTKQFKMSIPTHEKCKTHKFTILNPKKFSWKSEFCVQVNWSLVG